jgi:hypothetical protein
MNASEARVIDRPETDRWIACPEHFGLGESRPVDVSVIQKDPCLSLYCLDFESDSALFTRVPKDTRVEDAVFMYEAQRTLATHVVRIPLSALSCVAEEARIDPSRIVLIHSVGRCGSTLVSKALSKSDGVASLSEPDVFTQLVSHWGKDGFHGAGREQLLRDCTVVQCIPSALRGYTRFALKFRSYVTTMGPMYARAVPAARTVFLYRSLVPWLRSYVRMLGGGELNAPFGSDYYIEFISRIVPQLSGIEQPTLAEVAVCNWLGSMEAATQMQREHVPLFLLRYEELNQTPSAALRSLIGWLDFPAPTQADLDAVLKEDSQSGTYLNQKAVREIEVQITAETLDHINRFATQNSQLVGPNTVLEGTFTFDPSAEST